MDINVTLTIKLDSATLAVLGAVLALGKQQGLFDAKPADAAPAVAGEAPKRPRKSKDDAPAAVPEPSPTPPALATTQPSAAKAATADLTGAAEITLKDLTDLVTDTLDKAGTPPVRGVFQKFKVAKLSELPPASYPAFAAALNEARSMVS